jgi:eukaryotic-like serine/threonine-protein kinase
MKNEPKNNVGTIDRTGQQLGNYRLVSSLELSRHSGVYLGEHIQYKHQCVVKVWQLQLKEELANSFLSQARGLTQLVHPHILRVRDAGVEQLVPFLVMDYLPYVTLQQRTSHGIPKPLADIISLLQPLAEALQYAHNNGFLHKDIRPRHILLGRNNDVLLSDFNIPALHQSEQQPNHLKAAQVTELLGYMPPEQMRGRAVPASDQYALAVVIYEWLNGDLPFHGSYGEIVKQHLHAQPPSLRRKVPSIPAAFEGVLFKALAKDPRQRYSSVTAFVQALKSEYESAAAHLAVPSLATARGIPVAPVSGRNAVSPYIPGPNTPQAQWQPAPSLQVPPVPTPAMPAPPFPPVPAQYAAMPQLQPAPITPAPSAPSAARNTPVPPQKTKSGPSISRRAFVAGMVGVAVLGGGAAWLGLSQKWSLSSLSSGSTNTSGNQAANSDLPRGATLIYRGHPARVNASAWSPDGKLIASASDDHTVQLCDAKAGNTTLTYRGHSAEVYALAWSPNGKYLASAGADKTVQVWDTATGNTVRTYLKHSDQVNSVAWSANSTLVASGSDDHTVQVWNIATGEVAMIYSQHTAGVLTVAWSPDNTVIASGSWDNTVKAFSTIQTESFAIGGTVFDYRGHTAEVYAVAWSPDGRRIASASGDKVVQVGNGSNGATLFTYTGHSDVVHSVAWSPDAKYLASASADNTVQVWSTHSKQKITSDKIFTYRGHSSSVYDVAWSPNSARLASTSSDNTLQEWRPV